MKGVMLTLVLAAAAALTICTCGMGLAAAALIGAAVGAAAVTTAVSVADAKTGTGRSADEFAKELLLGTGAGAAAGAFIYSMGPGIAQMRAGKVGGMTMLGQGALYQTSAAFKAPFLTQVASHMPTIANATVNAVIGGRALRRGNAVITSITNENLILEIFFGGNEEIYDFFEKALDYIDEVFDFIPDVYLDMPGTSNKADVDFVDDGGTEPTRPLNRAEQKRFDTSVKGQVDADGPLTGNSGSWQGDADGSSAAIRTLGNAGVVITNYSNEIESGSGSVIKNIQSKSPQQLIEDGWEDITNPKMAANTNSREFYDPKSGLKIRFDKGVDGANGFEAVDHYHVMNPNYTNKKVDYYLDIDGKPVGKGSKASHIVIKGEE